MRRLDRTLRRGSPAPKSLAARALSAIRRNGGTLLLPGLPRNWLDSAGTIAATVDNPVGLVQDSVGSNHATQPTTASKPLLRRGLVNQLLWSGDLGNAAWSTFAPSFTRTLEAAAGPDSDAAWRITATATAGVPVRSLSAASTTVTFAVSYKAGTINPNGWMVRNATTSTNLVGSITSVPMPDGWTLMSVAVTSGITIGDTLSLYFGTVSGVPEGVYWFLHRAALFQGTVTASEILAAGGIPTTTTAPASSALGRYAWQFDGSNDFLQTGITTGNEGWVCAGVTASNNTSNQTIFGNGAGDSTANGIWFARTSGASTYGFSLSDGSGGGPRDVLTTATAPLNSPCVLDGGWDAATMMTAVNGTETARSKTKDPTHTEGIRIGGLYSFFHPGSMSAIIHCPVLPSAADRALIRRFIGSLQGQQL